VEFQHFAAQPGLERVSPEQRRWQVEYGMDAKVMQDRVEAAHKQAMEAESKQEHLKRLQLWEPTATVSLGYPRLHSQAVMTTHPKTQTLNMSNNSSMM